MDLKKIFIKDACPTKIGGQAVMEGIMMRGEKRTAVCIRLPDDSIFIKTEGLKEPGKLAKVPLIRGLVAFIGSLVVGTKILMYSADVLENSDALTAGRSAQPSAETADAGGIAAGADAVGSAALEGKAGEPETDKVTAWLEKHFGEKGAWNIMLYSSVVFAVLFTVVIFILGPTWATNLFSHWVSNEVTLNLIEGVLRILLFVLYAWGISFMKDIRTVFEFHGAEHECIHCFENGLELTPDNCQSFPTLHPRCGTSFLMFVFLIALILFSLLGWPNLFWRITSRILLIPIIAGLSYELLKWAGRSDNWVVKILSLPGLWLQKITTNKPNEKELEVAIAAMKAVMVPDDTPYIEGICDLNGNLIEAKCGTARKGKAAGGVAAE